MPGASSEVKKDRFEYEAIVSFLLVAPTLIAVETQAGELMALTALLLPAEMTVAMPADRRLSIAGLTDEPSHVEVFVPPPRLRFAEAMLYAVRRV